MAPGSLLIRAAHFASSLPSNMNVVPITVETFTLPARCTGQYLDHVKPIFVVPGRAAEQRSKSEVRLGACLTGHRLVRCVGGRCSPVTAAVGAVAARLSSCIQLLLHDRLGPAGLSSWLLTQHGPITSSKKGFGSRCYIGVPKVWKRALLPIQ